MKGLATTIFASVGIAALSAAGDFIWATWITRPTTAHGLIHGAILFCAIGVVLGILAGRPAAGAAAGAALGAAAAGTFYLTAPLFGYSMMFVVWFGVWMALGLLYARLSDSEAPLRAVVARGAMAAAASGLAFYSISGIWMPFDPQGWDYAVHFAAWTAAYFPGFAALLLARHV